MTAATTPPAATPRQRPGSNATGNASSAAAEAASTPPPLQSWYSATSENVTVARPTPSHVQSTGAASTASQNRAPPRERRRRAASTAAALRRANPTVSRAHRHTTSTRTRAGAGPAGGPYHATCSRTIAHSRIHTPEVAGARTRAVTSTVSPGRTGCGKLVRSPSCSTIVPSRASQWYERWSPAASDQVARPSLRTRTRTSRLRPVQSSRGVC